jgi:thiamine pyrophosphate-dependent acetolactate synthase large subunit-like protein
MCTLGDQGFTNSLQGLIAAVQQHAKVLFVVCNNGEAVSLKKQAGASFGDAERPYLTNVPGFSYTALARSLGIPAARVEVPVGGLDGLVDKALGALSLRMNEAAAAVGPTLIELVLPSDQTMWRGIWLTQGFEQRQAVAA